nr:MAG TPA: hypothetical protein [Caudoviricetes sp.]DAX46654.1 MAG TPA: hypothetical protein [Bacteriophage sp.]
MTGWVCCPADADFAAAIFLSFSHKSFSTV